jgi:sulfide:quinone oxidoreductase
VAIGEFTDRRAAGIRDDADVRTLREADDPVMHSEPMHVVVGGAGVAALELALALRELAPGLTSVELVAPEHEFVYRPLAVAEPFRSGTARRFPLDKLVRAAGAELRRASVARVNADVKEVELDDGTRVAYDALVLAFGARARAAVPGAVTFRGVGDRAAIDAVLDRASAGLVRRIAFVLPAGPGWPLPLYELAMLTREYLVDRLTRGVELVVVTPEARPLELFGSAASDAVEQLLEIRSIELRTSSVAVSWDDDELQLADGSRIAADAAIALPRLEGPDIAGVPRDAHGFVATDDFGWVLGLTDVYAAGDMTQCPVKQGGIASQQADAVAASIAADAGAGVRPASFRPVLRGLLLTGMVPRFLRAEDRGTPAVVDTQPLWWPPGKIVGRYLSPFLAEQLGLASDFTPPAAVDAVAVDVAIDTLDHASWSSL